MGRAYRKIKYLPVILIFGILLGYFVERTFNADKKTLYPVDLKRAQWISPVSESAQSYFRKEFYLTDDIRHAWMAVSATDSYIVYVNGNVVGNKSFTSLAVSGMYDISKNLKRGKNVLAVLVRKKSSPRTTGLALEGAYVDSSGHEHLFASDSTWKASLYEERQGNGDILWYSSVFDDTLWRDVKVDKQPKQVNAYALDVHPRMITDYPRGYLIWHQDPRVRSAAFTKILHLDKKPEEAWLRVAGRGNINLSVNEMMIGSPVDNAKKLHIYRISPFMESGVNRITIEMEKHPGQQGLFADGFMTIDGEVTKIQTDASWTTAEEPADLFTPGSIKKYPAIVVSAAESINLAEYQKVYDEIILPDIFSLKRSIVSLVVILITLLLAAGSWIYSASLWNRFAGVNIDEALELFAISHLPALFFMAYMFFTRYDVNHNPFHPFQGKFIFWSLMILMASQLFLVFENWIRFRQHVMSEDSIKNFNRGDI